MYAGCGYFAIIWLQIETKRINLIRGIIYGVANKL